MDHTVEGEQGRMVSERYLEWTKVNTMYTSYAVHCQDVVQYLRKEAGRVGEERSQDGTKAAQAVGRYLRDTLVPYYEAEARKFCDRQIAHAQERPPQK